MVFVFQYREIKYKEWIRRKYHRVQSTTEKSTQIWEIEKASLRHLNNEKKAIMQTFWVEMSKFKYPEAENKFDSFKERRQLRKLVGEMDTSRSQSFVDHDKKFGIY